MIYSALLVGLSFSLAPFVSAHGLVQSILINGTLYDGYPAFNAQNNPQRIIRAMFNNGPITDVESAPIACNGANTPAALVANVDAGSTVTYKWDVWPEGHKGPITNYLASCGDAGCTTFDATTGKYFKIDESGFDPSSNTWATDTLINNALSYSFVIPADIPSGQYLLRHEILALHDTGKPQYYPSCAQINVVGGKASALPTENLASFPGAYSPTDSGYLANIYYPPLTSYQIEGPPLFQTDAAAGNSTAPASSTSSSAPSSTVTSSSSQSASVPTTTVRVCRSLSNIGAGPALSSQRRRNVHKQKREAAIAAAPRFVRAILGRSLH